MLLCYNHVQWAHTQCSDLLNLTGDIWKGKSRAVHFWAPSGLIPQPRWQVLERYLLTMIILIKSKIKSGKYTLYSTMKTRRHMRELGTNGVGLCVFRSFAVALYFPTIHHLDVAARVVFLKSKALHCLRPNSQPHLCSVTLVPQDSPLNRLFSFIFSWISNNHSEERMLLGTLWLAYKINKNRVHFSVICLYLNLFH